MTSLGLHHELARAESVRRLERLPGEAGRRARRSLTDWLFRAQPDPSSATRVRRQHPDDGRDAVKHRYRRDADRGDHGPIRHDEGKS